MALQYQIIPVTAFLQNSTVLWCDTTKHAAVVDPGGDIERLQSFIQSHALQVQHILLTHGHVDHAGAAEALARYYHVPIAGPHEADRFWLSMLSEQARLFHFPHPVPEKMTLPIGWLTHQDRIVLGDEILEVLHCPGHTPGHIVFYNQRARLVVVGDVLFKNAIGRTDLPGGDGRVLRQSIRRHLFTLPDATCVIPGHGSMTTIGDEKHHNPHFCAE